MRSSKSRSRSKNNRNRSMGNVVNRVFDSSGPEGKVRGTPQQIIDKYNQLARDSQLSNDRVATENFQQHAEHYLRMLAEAQREQAERQAQNQQNQQDRQPRNTNQGGGGQPQAAADVQPADTPQPEVRAEAHDAQPDVIDVQPSADDSPLVETPENRQPKQRRPRKKPEPKAEGEAQPVAEDQPAPDAAE